MAAVRKQSVGGAVFDVLNILIIGAFAFICVYPFALGLVVSFSSEGSVIRNGYTLFPDELTTTAYQTIFSRGSRVLRSYQVSVIVTVVGTILNVMATSMIAYVVSNSNVKYRNHLTFFMFFTMVFTGGLAPQYIVWTSLGLRNSYWGMILPIVVSAWNVFLLRNFFKTVPESIPESARMDGAGELTILTRLMIPLAVPGIATIALFVSIAYWNDFFHAVILINKPDLYPLQVLMRQVLSDFLFVAPTGLEREFVVNQIQPPPEGVRMATMMMTVGPIILVYPFAQRYFVRGIVIGAIKG